MYLVVAGVGCCGLVVDCGGVQERWVDLGFCFLGGVRLLWWGGW